MISVIVPVYNTSKYLRTCMRSIQRQTYRDLEIIAVDDGSTDDSLLILQEFSRTDDRIHVICQKNQGVSCARNAGINAAHGEFISFVDSDDTLEPDLYETLFNLIQQYDVPIAHCSYTRISNGTVKPIGNSGSVFVQSREEALTCFAEGRLFIGSCWNKLYARDLFEGIRFCSNFKVSEDLLVNFQVFCKVDRTVFADVCKYNYLTSDTSACRNVPSVKQAQDHLAVDRILKGLNDCTNLKDLMEQRILHSLLSYYKALLYTHHPDTSLLKNISDEINALSRRGYTFSPKNKFMYFMMLHFPLCFKIMYRIYDRIRVPNYDVR